MNYYILTLDTLTNLFNIIESGDNIKFRYSFYDKEIENFENINIGDLILGYKKNPKNTIEILFKVSDTEEGFINLEKNIELSKGYEIKDINLINELERRKLYEINYDDFIELYNNFIDNIPKFSTDRTRKEISSKNQIIYQTNYYSKFERNKIFFGAPGTGKSHLLNEKKEELLYAGGEYERVTFHPDYTYGNFVGTYKPITKITEDDEIISYEYIPGPFMRLLVKTLKNNTNGDIKPSLLIIEEINRANMGAVFGDIFQLLDRDSKNTSEYPIQASEDIKNYMSKELGGDPEDYTEIQIPDNMFIWATMNSADQGVFFMSTAFKRRWEFTYLDINNDEDKIPDKKITVGKGDYEIEIDWNSIRKAINNQLLKYGINEDKLIGPFFITLDYDTDKFNKIFKNKVIMYLFEDAAKPNRQSLFSGARTNQDYLTFSEICSKFDDIGINIFCENIRNQFK